VRETVTVGQALIEIDVDMGEKPSSSAKDLKPEEIEEPVAKQYSAGQRQEKIEEAPVPPKQQQPMALAASLSLSQEVLMSAYRGSRPENKVTNASISPSQYTMLIDCFLVPGQKMIRMCMRTEERLK